MFSDTESVVRVKRYFKTVQNRDRVTGLPVTYRVMLDWDLGSVDNGYLMIAGAPYQLFSADIYGSNVKDTRVLETHEQMPLSELEGATTRTIYGELHFKHPNI